MKKNFLLFCFIAISNLAFCQFPAPYCNEFYPSGVEPITLVTFQSINNASSAIAGGTAHEDFTLSVTAASVIAGSSYTMSVRGNTVGNFINYIRVFIDWNNDGDFLDPNESYDIGTITNSSGLDGLQAVNTIVVPPGTTNGYKRMRVTKKYAGYQTPCNTIGYGQAEDYQVRVYSMAPYCTEAYPSNVEPITLVTFFYNAVSSSAVVNGSPENEDFTNIAPTRVVAGRSYAISVKGNTDGIPYTDYIRAFIDWNNDGDFFDAGESYDIGTITGSTGLDAIQASNFIAIPPGTPAGNYRMRVSKKYAGYPPPCNTGGFGQSEDYLIQVYSMAPYCTDSYPSNIEPITKVDFSAISNWTNALLNGSPDNEDFTYINGVVVPGNTYTMKVAGNTDGNYTDYISVFIDWNGNGDFLDPNEVFNIGTITNSTGQDAIFISGPIAVPAGTSLGNKRMRVVKHFGGYLSPCTSYGFGQSEDYTLSVVGSIKAVLSTGNAYLQGDYVEVGINQCGGWGTTTTAPQGYHARSGVTIASNYNAQLSLGFVADSDKDGWTTGSPSKYNGDYFMPASPYIGWGINFNGLSYGTDRTNSTQTNCALMVGTSNPNQTFSGVNVSATGYATKAESVWEGTHNGLKIQKITTVKQDKVYFTARIKIYNTTAFSISNIYYGEYINPDPEAYYNDIYTANLNTINTIVNQNPTNGQALVQAISSPHNVYVALGTKDCRAKVFRSPSNVVPNFSPINWYSGGGNVSLTGADAIATNLCYGIAYNIGTLAPGDSTSFLYTYILKATDFDEALSETEPSFLSNNISILNDGTITPCANTPVDVSIVDGDYYNWVWSPASGLNTTTGENVTITPGTTPITYTITGTGTCANKTITLNVNPVNTTDVVTTPASIVKCISDPPVLLTASGGDFTDAVILNEKFNSLYDNWTKLNNSTGGVPANAAWTLRPNNYIYAATTFNSNDNTQFYLSNSDAQGNGSTIATILQSPAFSTLNYNSVNLSFYHYFREDAAASTAVVEASTDRINWTNLQTYTSTTGSSSSFSLETIALTPAFIDQPLVYIRFKYDGSWSSYWAIDNVQVTGSGQPLVWAPITGLYNDAAGTIPYTGVITTSVYANPALTTVYTASSLVGNCSKTADATVTVNNPTNILAGVVGAATCQNKAVDNAGTVYNATSCDLIGKVTPAGASPVAGDINMCVTLDDMAGPLPEFNAEPYLTRHYDVEPALNAATATARVTFYFTQEEFDNYNAKNSVWPDLPTGPGDVVGIANLRMSQYHGTPTSTPSSPGQYTGTGEYIDPADVDIVWNGSYWEVTIDVTGFSGFYVHTNFRYILPITLNYFNGNTNGNDNILNWKVNCNNTNGISYTLERSGDAVHYTGISDYHPSFAQCGSPFSYTDVNAPKGINHYRLKIIAPDGAISYSNQVVLSNDYKGSDIINLSPVPVPADGNFALTLVTEKQGKAELTIMDLQGRVVLRKPINVVKGANMYNLNIAELAAGSYQLIEYRQDQPTRTIRFVKL